MKKIGVLDIQGSVEEHFEMLKKLADLRGGFEAVLIKKAENLVGVVGLIIPGGESTTIGKLMTKFDLDKAIKQAYKNGMAIWGTCAGAILLAKKIRGGKEVKSLNLMNIEVERNAYGRQIDSFEADIDFDFCVGSKSCEKMIKKVPAVFIRAPKILNTSDDVKALAHHNGEIVAVLEGRLFATTFHPEMTDSFAIHEWFITRALG